MDWYSDAALLAAFPTAAGLDPAAFAQLFLDAVAVYDHATTQPGISDADLRTWAESQGIGPDRVTSALAVLQDGGKLVRLPFSGPLAPPTPAPAGSRLSAAFSAAELRKAAERLKLDVPKSAAKDDVAAAVSDAL